MALPPNQSILTTSIVSLEAESLTVKLVNTVEDFAQLQLHWEHIANADDEAGIFNGWAWNWLWWKHYGEKGELHILTVERSGELIAIAPLYSRVTRVLRMFRVETLAFVGSAGDTSPDDLNIVALPEHRTVVVEKICDYLINKATYKRLWLTDIPESSNLWRHLNLVLAHAPGFQNASVRQERFVRELPETWDQYRGLLSRNTHKQIKRRRNRFNRQLSVRIILCDTRDTVNEAKNALISLHRARWASKGLEGSFVSDAYVNFHKDMIDVMFERGELWLVSMHSDNKIVGVEYSFCVKGTLSFFQTGFDPDYEHLSPGHLLMTYAIENAIEKGVRRIDLLRGDYSYKKSYANQTIASCGVDYFYPDKFNYLLKAVQQGRCLSRYCAKRLAWFASR